LPAAPGVIASVSRGRSWAGAGAGLALAVLICLLAPAGANGQVPAGFFGVVPQGPLAPRDFERMRGLDLTIRMPIYWFEVEPEPGRYDFSVPDRIVAEAAVRGIGVLPFVYGSPPWVATDQARPPLDSAAARRAWSAFLSRLVGRYGPAGDFWDGREAKRPIRRWQIWNEPNFAIFWRPGPSPRGYARLLKISARAVRRLDPKAEIAAAAVAPVAGDLRPWEFLRRLYRVPGVESAFDVAALHPYAVSVRGVEYAVRQTRQVLAQAGDGRLPLLVTELGVASASQVPNPFDRGPRGQARFLRRAFARLSTHRERWRLDGVYWFAWQDLPRPDPSCVFCQFAGLVDFQGTPKPSWWSFRRSLLRAEAGPVR